MNFQELVDTYAIPACIVSVQKLSDEKYGEIRIIAGNKRYLEDNHLPEDVVFGDLYDKYAPNDHNFESFAFRSAVKKENLHAYIQPDRYEVWLDCNWIPLSMNDGDIYYMVFTMEMFPVVDENKLLDREADVNNDVLKTCIKLHKGNDFEKTMQEVTADVKELCTPQFCRILIRDNITKECVILSDEGEDDVFALNLTMTMEKSLYEVTECWIKDIGGSNCIIARNRDEMSMIKERDPTWYKSICDYNVTSLILFPIEYGKEVVGFIWAANFDEKKAQKIKDTLELTSYFIGSFVINHQLFGRLEKMSTTDMLTGLLNRGAMDKRLEGILSKKSEAFMSLGIYFADVNGLKRTNDAFGHPAGDRLLRSAANLLREVFEGYEIYRVGGDEFMIFCPNMDKKTFEEKLDYIREIQKERGDIILSIGGTFETDTSKIIEDMKEADIRMYESKKLYYESIINEKA